MPKTEETFPEFIEALRALEPWKRQAIIELMRDWRAGVQRDAEWLIGRSEELRLEAQS